MCGLQKPETRDVAENDNWQYAVWARALIVIAVPRLLDHVTFEYKALLQSIAIAVGLACWFALQRHWKPYDGHAKLPILLPRVEQNALAQRLLGANIFFVVVGVLFDATGPGGIFLSHGGDTVDLELLRALHGFSDAILSTLLLLPALYVLVRLCQERHTLLSHSQWMAAGLVRHLRRDKPLVQTTAIVPAHEAD